MTDTIRDLLISLASHMAYMQGQLEASRALEDPEDYYWYRESVLLRQKVTDALTDEPAVPEGREPVAVAGQPGDGEVAELVAWLRSNALTVKKASGNPANGARQRMNRAAELLQHLSPPQPVPVSERLPGPGEMTEDGEVWVDDPGHDYPIADSGDYDWEPHKWIMRPISRFDAKYGRRWLPAHALPVPGQEVEG